MSERLVMCSVREVSGLGGAQGAVVAVSPAEGGWARTGPWLTVGLGPGPGQPWGAQWLIWQEPWLCRGGGLGPGRVEPGQSAGVDIGLVALSTSVPNVPRRRVSRRGSASLLSVGGDALVGTVGRVGGLGGPGLFFGPCRQDLGVQQGRSQVQAALRHPRQPAPTTVALGRAPVSGLKAAPPAQACPGAGVNTGELARAHEEPSVAGGGDKERRVEVGVARAVGGQRKGSWGLEPRPVQAGDSDGIAHSPRLRFESRFHPFHSGRPRLPCAGLGFLICKMGPRGDVRWVAARVTPGPEGGVPIPAECFLAVCVSL